MNMDMGDVQAILAIGFLFLIIICQAALNLWFIFKNETLTKSSSELRVAAEEFKRQMDARADDMQGKINNLERNIATRLDANIELLEKMLTPREMIEG